MQYQIQSWSQIHLENVDRKINIFLKHYSVSKYVGLIVGFSIILYTLLRAEGLFLIIAQCLLGIVLVVLSFMSCKDRLELIFTIEKKERSYILINSLNTKKASLVKIESIELHSDDDTWASVLCFIDEKETILGIIESQDTVPFRGQSVVSKIRNIFEIEVSRIVIKNSQEYQKLKAKLNSKLG